MSSISRDLYRSASWWLTTVSSRVVAAGLPDVSLFSTLVCDTKQLESSNEEYQQMQTSVPADKTAVMSALHERLHPSVWTYRYRQSLTSRAAHREGCMADGIANMWQVHRKYSACSSGSTRKKLHSGGFRTKNTTSPPSSSLQFGAQPQPCSLLSQLGLACSHSRLWDPPQLHSRRYQHTNAATKERVSEANAILQVNSLVTRHCCLSSFAVLACYWGKLVVASRSLIY